VSELQGFPGGFKENEVILDMQRKFKDCLIEMNNNKYTRNLPNTSKSVTTVTIFFPFRFSDLITTLVFLFLSASASNFRSSLALASFGVAAGVNFILPTCSVTK
jgi:hypothetical protein